VERKIRDLRILEMLQSRGKVIGHMRAIYQCSFLGIQYFRCKLVLVSCCWCYYLYLREIISNMPLLLSEMFYAILLRQGGVVW